jgi:hypothetical protein
MRIICGMTRGTKRVEGLKEEQVTSYKEEGIWRTLKGKTTSLITITITAQKMVVPDPRSILRLRLLMEMQNESHQF